MRSTNKIKLYPLSKSEIRMTGRPNGVHRMINMMRVIRGPENAKLEVWVGASGMKIELYPSTYPPNGPIIWNLSGFPAKFIESATNAVMKKDPSQWHSFDMCMRNLGGSFARREMQAEEITLTVDAPLQEIEFSIILRITEVAKLTQMIEQFWFED